MKTRWGRVVDEDRMESDGGVGNMMGSEIILTQWN